MRRRGRVEESDDDDDDAMEVSQSSSPSRRSSRVNRRANTSEHSDSDEDEDSDRANHNRNRNRNANDSDSDSDDDNDVVRDEHKTELATEADLSDDTDDDEDDLDMQSRPDFASFLPNFVSKLGDQSRKISLDIEDGVLPRLIDTAVSLAEHSTNDFKAHSAQLQSTMRTLLDLMSDAKIEKELYAQMADQIREGAFDEDSQSALNENANVNNPTLTGDWSGFLDSARAALAGEVNGSGAVSTDGAGRIKSEMVAHRDAFAQQFTDSIQRDDIEGFESGEEEAEDEESDDDLEIERGDGKGNVGQLKCPLTMTVMVEPVKSNVCGHSFERKAIDDYIMTKVRNKELVECPLSGCGRVLSRDGFIRDVRVEKLIKAHNRRKQEEDGEDEQMFDLTLANQ